MRVNKRKVYIYSFSVFLALLGITSIYFITTSLMLSDIVSIHYAAAVLKTNSTDMQKAVPEVMWQGAAAFAWLLFVYFVTAVHGLNMLDEWLKKRWEHG